MLKKKYKFIIIIVLLLELVILINYNTNIKKNIINPKISNLDTNFQNPNIIENIDNRGSDFYQLANVKIQNDQYAYSNIPSRRVSNWIRCTDFDFNLPDNSIIEGIEVQIDDYSVFLNGIFAQDIYLVLNGIKIGIDKESGSSIGYFDTDTYRVYGNPTDIWNTELTQIDIESSTFGIQIFYWNTNSFMSNIVNIDNIQINIYYSTDDIPIEPICKAESIILMSFMFGIISIMLFLIILMLFLYKKIDKFLPTLILFLFSLIIGVSSIAIVNLPFIPYFSLFFILFQTSIFIIKSLKIYK